MVAMGASDAIAAILKTWSPSSNVKLAVRVCNHDVFPCCVCMFLPLMWNWQFGYVTMCSLVVFVCSFLSCETGSSGMSPRCVALLCLYVPSSHVKLAVRVCNDVFPCCVCMCCKLLLFSYYHRRTGVGGVGKHRPFCLRQGLSWGLLPK